MKKLMTSLSPLFVLSLAACGGGAESSGEAENDLSKEESAQAFDETGTRTSSATESAQNSAAFQQGFDTLAAELDVSAEVSCADGGSASVEGSMTVPDDEQSLDSEMNASVSFQGCAENGVTIDGDLSSWFQTTTDESGSIAMSMTMEGAVAFSGDIEGSCAMDAAIDVSMTVDNDTGSFDIQVEANGSFCGHPLDELNTEFTDPGGWEGGA